MNFRKSVATESLRINAGAGHDTVYGGAGDDIIFGLGGSDTIYGGKSNDNLHGNAGSDDLHGGAGTRATTYCLAATAQNTTCDYRTANSNRRHHPSCNGEKIIMNKQTIMLVLMILMSVALRFDEARAQPGLPLIDAHSQFDQDVEPEEIVPLLNRAGIAHVILATRGRQSWEDLSELARSHPNRITASVRTKGGAYRDNRKGYYRKLEAQLSDPALKAMAELILWHAAKRGGKAPKVTFTPDAPQVQTALEYALDRGWPFVVHIEFRSAMMAGDYDGHMNALENLLKQHPKHPFALTHMGQLSAEEARKLIEAHPKFIS